MFSSWAGAIPAANCQGQFRHTAAEPKLVTLGPVAETEPSISPDGRWIAFQYFSVNSPDVPQIWVMETARGFASARPLVDGLGYAAEISWSPDSVWLSFISSTTVSQRTTEQIYKINVATNELAQITHFPAGTLLGDSTAWSSKGLIAFERESDIYGVWDSGSGEVLLLGTSSVLSDRRPSNIRFSPDGNLLTFSAENRDQNESEIWVADLRDQSINRLTKLHFDIFPSWVGQQRIAFVRETKDETSKIQILSLSNGALRSITSGHVDITPCVDVVGHQLYFSRKGKVPEEFKNVGFLVGFHIWKLTLKEWSTGGWPPPNTLR